MRIFFILMISCFLAGCAATQKALPFQNPDVFVLSKKILGKNHYVVIPPKEEIISGQLEEAITTVARSFAQGEIRDTRLSIASFSSEATAKIIREALIRNQGKRLSRLRILYFGEKQYDKDVKAAVRSFGAKYYFRELRPKNNLKEQNDECPFR